MAESTNITWTDHSFNPWWGCTKIAPGCDNCYAAALDHRTGGSYWNAHQQPRRTSARNWQQVTRWHQKAVADNRRYKVFCGSMMDWCDKDAPAGARDDLFALIRATPMLDWQLLTKRATLIERCLPNDWGDGYDNVWLGVTCEDRKHGYPRVEALRQIPAKIRFVSAEPLLEALDGVGPRLRDIHWVIIGGESGPGHRKMDEEWVSALRFSCALRRIPVWFKQWGGNGKDKGGCEIDGREIKQWPMSDRPRRTGGTFMPIRLDELHRDSDLVRAAYAMVHAHREHESALPALKDVREQFPDVPDDYLICLWVGINAKDREELV